MEAANAGSISAPSVRQAELAKERAATRLVQAQAQLEADKEKVELKDKDEAEFAQAQAELKAAEEKLTAKLAKHGRN